MHFWLIKDGEQLPTEPGIRRLRTGMLAAELAHRGHTVTWWASTFSHQQKSLQASSDTTLDVDDGYTIRLLHAGTYPQNVSIQRYVHHRKTATRFRTIAEQSTKPDAIIAALPTIDLAHEAVRFGREHGVPVVVDVRDPWPDVFVNKAPAGLKTLVRVATLGDDRRASSALAGATSLVAASHGFLRWGARRAGRPIRDIDRVFYLGRPPSEPLSHPTEQTSNLRRRVAGKITCTFVGSFGLSYELPLICEVARRFAGDDRVRFVLAGDGVQRALVDRAAAELPNLIAPGWISEAEIGDLLSITDIGLVPCISAPDTMPNKVFDYMAARLPIVSSLEGEMVDILERTKAGFSYRVGDADALERHIRSLVDDLALRRRLADNSLAAFEREFSAANIYPAYADHAERVATNSRA